MSAPAETASPDPIRRNLRLEWLLVTALCAALALAVALMAPGNRADNAFYDTGQRLRTTAVSQDLLLVRIDEPSLRALGRWPWPRRIHADLVRTLDAAGARVIAFDVLFDEPTPDDALFAQAVAAARAPVIAARDYSSLADAPFAEAAPQEPTLLLQSFDSTAHVIIERDSDGITRRMAPLLSIFQGARNLSELHLAEAVYGAANAKRQSPLARESGNGNGNGSVLIPFVGEADPFRSISYAAVLKGEVPPAFLRDKIILIGASAPGLGDTHPMPAAGGGTGYGLDIVAHSLNAMLTGAAIHSVRGMPHALMSALCVVLLMAILARLTPRLSLPVSLAAVASVIAISFLLLSRDIWFAPAAATAGMIAAYPLWSWRRLSAIDRIVGQELARFAPGEQINIPTTAERLLPDPAALRVDRLRQAIGEIEALRRFVSDALDQLPDPMLVTDQTGMVRLANRAATALFGPAPASLKSILPQAAHGNEYAGPDGRSFSIRAAPLTDSGGIVRGDIWYLADISAERRARDERERVLRFLSHDMRSPQAAIIALLQQDDLSAPETVARIRHYATRTLDLADNFIHLARLQTREPALEPVELGGIVQEAVDELWPIARDAGATITIAPSDDLTDDPADDEHGKTAQDGYWIVGEGPTLHRVMTNIIGNAIRYGGPQVHIRITLEHMAGQMIAVAIADDGPGIPAEQREAIFTEFGQAANASSATGTGLGLSYVRTAVAQHQGMIRHEAVEPHGACFRIILPALRDDGADGCGADD